MRIRERGTISGAFEALRSDYQAAKSSRFRRRRTGVAATGSGADYHYRSESDYLKLMEQARDMDRNDTIVGTTIDRAVTQTVQGGLTLDPQTPDPKLNADLWARWDDWSNDPEQCDVSGEMTFGELESLALRQHLADGDHFGLPLAEGSLQMVEAHRCRTPRNTKKNVVHGIMLDDRRRRLEYWFTKDEIDPFRPVTKVGEMTRYPARDDDGQRQVFHLYNPKRTSQTRGVTALAPIFDCLGMFEDINFARLVQQQVVSCFGVMHEYDANSSPPGMAGFQRGEATTRTRGDGSTQRTQGIAPGMEFFGAPGEKLRAFTSGVPNAEFFDHVRLILQLVGINLGMPLVLLLMDASETNFSGYRGAIDQARMGFRNNQRWLVRRFHRPIYRWKLSQWLAEDPALLHAFETHGDKIFAAKWNCPKWPYIEPLKDASADLLKMRNALSSPRRIFADRGEDWEEVAVEIIADNAFAIRRAKRVAQRINAKYKDDPVHWRELLSLPTPDGVHVTVGAPESSDANEQPAARDKPAKSPPAKGRSNAE